MKRKMNEYSRSSSSDSDQQFTLPKLTRILLVISMCTMLGYFFLSSQTTSSTYYNNAFVSSLFYTLNKYQGINTDNWRSRNPLPANTEVLDLGLSDYNDPANSTVRKPRADHRERGRIAGRRTSDHQDRPKDTDYVHSDPLLSAANPMVQMMHKLEPDDSFTTGKLVPRSYGVINSTDELKIILLWTLYPITQLDWGFGLGHEPFIDNECPVSNCMTTNNKSLVKQASAIAFHPPKIMYSYILPRVRYPNQTYVIHLRKPPAIFTFSDSFDGVFNLTMAYRADADIPVPYAIVTTGDSSWRGTIDQLRTLITGKTKLVAWFVSNCNTSSMREKYVTQLQRYIPVDIYGRCGPLKCKQNRKQDCINMLERDYKFYLAFENSVCTEYITEKAYKVLQRYIVPVVYGGANYSLQTPPHSVINIRDFNSPLHLAKYLKELAGDEQRYMEYFNWKKRYSIVIPGGKYHMFCKLCELLNHPKHDTTVQKKLWDWWFNGTCSKPINVM